MSTQLVLGTSVQTTSVQEHLFKGEQVAYSEGMSSELSHVCPSALSLKCFQGKRTLVLLEKKKNGV